MADRFNINVRPYCGKCDDFDVEVIELFTPPYSDINPHIRTITCKNIKRCTAIENYLKEEYTMGVIKND